jgi:hypothetical protein
VHRRCSSDLLGHALNGAAPDPRAPTDRSGTTVTGSVYAKPYEKGATAQATGYSSIRRVKVS